MNHKNEKMGGLRAKRTRKKCARGHYNIYEGTPRERTKKVGNIEDSKRGYNLVVFKRVTQTPHTRCIFFCLIMIGHMIIKKLTSKN